MSSVPVITSIIVLLAGLVCYAFIAQTLSQRRQQKERLLLALKSRVRNFKFMLNGFPRGFLPKELILLVQRSLMQLLEQLTKLEPNQAAHREDLQVIAQQMAETQRLPPNSGQSAPIENVQQAKEIKTSLEDLYKFIFHLEGKKQVTRPQAELYRKVIRQQVLQLSIDAYTLHSRIAREKGKLRLAIHYLDVALKLALKERENDQLDSRINQLRSTIAELEARLASEATAEVETSGDETEQSAISSEWDKFGQEQSWKKKQIYD